MADQFNILDQSLTVEVTQRLTTGEEVVPRGLCTATNVATATQSLRLVYFTALKTELISQILTISGGTAAGATPTLVRLGVWTVDSSGNLTALVASTANDTALYASQNTAYTKSFSAPFTKQAGQRYAVGVLVVSGATIPTFQGSSGLIAITSQVPILTAAVAAQNDLPATATASPGGSASRFYAALLP